MADVAVVADVALPQSAMTRLQTLAIRQGQALLVRLLLDLQILGKMTIKDMCFRSFREDLQGVEVVKHTFELFNSVSPVSRKVFAKNGKNNGKFSIEQIKYLTHIA